MSYCKKRRKAQLLIKVVAGLGLAAKTNGSFRHLTGRSPVTLPESNHFLRDARRRDP